MYSTFNFQNKTMSTGLKGTRTGGVGGRGGQTPYLPPTARAGKIHPCGLKSHAYQSCCLVVFLFFFLAGQGGGGNQLGSFGL